MLKVSFEVQGRELLAASLKRLGSTDPIDDVLQEAAFEIEQRAKLRASVDTGRLRASIGTGRTGPMEQTIVVGVHYGPFVEFGTGQAGATGDQPGGVPGEYVHGPSPGRPSAPFLRPALLEVRELLNDPNTWKDLI